MSLVGFAGRNHRQQVGRRGANPVVDDRATTPEVFAPLHERFRFTVDAAALPHNAKLPRFWTPEDDGLAQDWTGERVWLNPPYSSIEEWVVKAADEWDHGRAETVVMLLPANRTEQGWWQRHIEPRRRERSIEVEFLAGRMRFIAAGDTEIKPNARPPFGVCLVIFPEDEPALTSRARECPECDENGQVEDVDDHRNRIPCPLCKGTAIDPASRANPDRQEAGDVG